MKQTLLWLDLEMTGLAAEHDLILQVAVMVTDDQLNVVAEGVEYVIHHDAASKVLVGMDAAIRTMHTNSGLLARVQESKQSVTDAEAQLIAFFKTYCELQKTLLCGNSIWVDRTFLRKHMPRFEELFFYRMIDVSTIKELALRWYPQLPPFQKQKKHTALADLHESLAELQYYREHVFK